MTRYAQSCRTMAKMGAPRLADFARPGNSRSKQSPVNTLIPTGASHSRREWEAEWRDLVFAKKSRSACGRIA